MTFAVFEWIATVGLALAVFLLWYNQRKLTRIIEETTENVVRQVKQVYEATHATARTCYELDTNLSCGELAGEVTRIRQHLEKAFPVSGAGGQSSTCQNPTGGDSGGKQ